ncbi:MAG TPA: protein kinase [Kofleriaceae bacterium]|nr:protein kinase [Kofleriaceae bacterium]
MSFGVSGKYRLERRLGGGGMAEVFVGSTVGAEGFSRRVAIKRVLPGYSDNAGFSQMFVSEAQISAQLVHPNIVSVLDFDRDAESRLFLVMELVDGKDLDTLLATGMLPVPVVIFVIGEVLRGLGFAHDLPSSTGMRGVVHRDVSPHNVLLSWEGAVKVSDFGIAKARAASEASASVFIKGKPAYMSPEQANGQPLDGRSDLFAVGVMLWEMLVGRRLFVAEDTRATLAAVLFGQIPRPRTLRPEIAKDLERVVMKLLERDLPARYATAEEAIADLMNCVDAPRGGREAMSAVLAERFPADAPVRQSVARARSLGVIPTPVPGTLAGSAPGPMRGDGFAGASGPVIGAGVGGLMPGALAHVPGPPTMTDPRLVAGAAPPVSQPGLGTLRSAPTSTLKLPRRRWVTVALALVGMTVAGTVAFFAVSAARRSANDQPVAAAGSDHAPGSAAGSDHRTDTGRNAGSGTRAGSDVSRDVQHDASPPPRAPSQDSVDAGVAVDAAVDTAAEAAADAGSPLNVRPPPSTNHSADADGHAPKPSDPTRTTGGGGRAAPIDGHFGTLRVTGFPVVTVTVDGKVLGDSPRSFLLKAGKHRVVLTNLLSNINETHNVLIVEHKDVTLGPGTN